MPTLNADGSVGTTRYVRQGDTTEPAVYITGPDWKFSTRTTQFLLTHESASVGQAGSGIGYVKENLYRAWETTFSHLPDRRQREQAASKWWRVEKTTDLARMANRNVVTLHTITNMNPDAYSRIAFPDTEIVDGINTDAASLRAQELKDLAVAIGKDPDALRQALDGIMGSDEHRSSRLRNGTIASIREAMGKPGPIVGNPY